MPYAAWPCRALGNIPGVPKVHFKGRQGDFYIMVRLLLASFWRTGCVSLSLREAGSLSCHP
jgi:hypothetical protein